MDHLMDHIHMDYFLCKGKYTNMYSEFVLIMYGKAEDTEDGHEGRSFYSQIPHAAPYGEGRQMVRRQRKVRRKSMT